MRWFVVALTLVTLVAGGVEVVRLSQVRELRVPLDDRRVGGVLLSGFHEGERDARGRYRWTTGRARALVSVPGLGRATTLSLWIGPAVPGDPPPEFVLALAGLPPMTIAVGEEPRRYLVLAPPSVTGRLELELSSATVTVPPDPRRIGVRVEGLSARTLGGELLWPAPLTVLLQVATALLVALIAARCGASGPGAVAVALAVALLLSVSAWLVPAVAPSYLVRLSAGAAFLASLTVVALPLLERRPAWLGPPAEVRALWGVAMFACGLRLAGALFPPFSAYDLGLNLGRLFATVHGALVATNESFEFGGGLTVYPSGPYLVLMPGMLAGLTPKLAVQGGIALLDGLGVLAVAALGRALELGRREVIFAAVVYAAVPIGLTTLWYGHTAQAFGQALMAPLAVALLIGLRGSPGPWPWIWTGLLLALALLSHIGVSILALAWLGLLWLVVTVRRTLTVTTWRRLSLSLLLGGLTGLIFVYGPVALDHLDVLRGLQFGGEGVAPKPSYNLIARAIWIAYTPLGLLLAVATLPLIRRRVFPPGAPALLGAWLGAGAGFWGVEMLTGLQVRYLVFLTPLVCLAAALALARLAGQGQWGQRLAWVLAIVIVLQGVALWLGGIFGPTAPSMIPLLR